MPWREATPEDGEVAYQCGCWIWTGYTDKDGRPHVRTATSTTTGARWVYEREGTRRIPLGQLLANLCGTRLCVNPRHHEPVTHAELAARTGVRKLTHGQARQAKRAVRRGMSMRQAALILDVDLDTIQRVCNGTHWTQREG